MRYIVTVSKPKAEKMIKHVVMFQFKPEAKDRLEAARERILSMKGQIPGVTDIEAGLDFLHSERSFDLGLIVTMKTREDLKTYAEHPVHQPVKDFLKGLYERSVAVDFEL